MTTGIAFLKKHPGSFPDYQKHLRAGVCVTCGTVPLKDCDPVTGMCTSCAESITSDDFDKLFYSKESIMLDLVKHLSTNRIIGDLISREKYKYVDGRLIASIVDDVMSIVQDAVNSNITKEVSHEG
jgi:hypothetical protein